MTAFEPRLRRTGRYLAQTFRLMVGVPDYGAYLSHMTAQHPDVMPMDYEAFFRERQQARYGGGAGSTSGRVARCC